MQTFHTTFAQLPLAQCAFPSKKRTLDGQQEPEVEDSMQQESVYSEAYSKKTRVASFFEDTDYSAELKASRDAIMGQDTAMDAQDDEDLDLDEEEANYVPKSTWEPHFASHTSQQQQQQQQRLYSPPSMSSMTSASGRSYIESSMPSTPADSPAASHFVGLFPPPIQSQPDVHNGTPRSAFPQQETHPCHTLPPPPPELPRKSVGMMEDDFPIRDPDASFSSTTEVEPYLRDHFFYGQQRAWSSLSTANHFKADQQHPA